MAPDDKDPPLVSPRSPSYERAREELANPSPPGEAQVVAMLNGLVEAEHEAERACREAAHAAKDRGLAIGLRLHIAEHAGRAQALSEMVTALGGSPPRADEVQPTHAAEVGRATSDAQMQEVLDKMRTDLRAAYDRALADPSLGPTHREAIQRLAPT
jgi:uncharacterized protein (TIGR02284 family)